MTDSIRPPEEADPALAQLRAADPAGGAEPDRAALAAAVQARLAAPADELAALRARHPRRWLTVAAVAAGALVIGGTGFALGSGTGTGTGGGTGTGPGGVITLGQPGPGGRAGNVLTAPKAATGAVDEAGTSSFPAGPWAGGRLVFTATGLSGAAGTAQAWAYDPASIFTADTATRLARALGVQGAPTLVGGGWTVGPSDGSGRSLQLQPDGLASITFYDPALDVYGCPSPDEQGSGAPSSGGTEPSLGKAQPVPAPKPAQPCATSTVGPAPQAADAIAKAKTLIGSLGVDAGGFEYEAQGSGSPQTSYVTASQVVGGERTGASWNIGLVGAGVQSLNGFLAPVVSLGSYDVLSARAAAARLTDPRFGVSYGGPVMYAEGKGAQPGPPTMAAGASTASPQLVPAPNRTVGPAPRPGAPFGWPVTPVTLTTARLGLTMDTQPDGATVLLPAYELSSADGQTWPVVAVTDAHLDFAPAS
jgi:hypothetical protein